MQMNLRTIFNSEKHSPNRKTVYTAVFLAFLFLASCSGGGGGSNGGTVPDSLVLSGTVLNNHTDESDADRAVEGAAVVLVKAGDAADSNSLSPIEDLANGNSSYPTAATGSDGFYQFATGDFSDAYPAEGTYFVYVDPPLGQSELLPGGNASRASLTLNPAAPIRRDILLSDAGGADAEYVGGFVCLICHEQQNSIRHTLHFVGLRGIGPDGTVTNDMMDMEDTSVYDLAANNLEMMGKFTDPATQYTAADDVTKTFWLGKDGTGLYFQLTSNVNPKFYLKLSYGGETGLWRGLFMTTVYAGSGTYAVNHGTDGDDYAYLVFAPFQYNEAPGAIDGKTFVTYHADWWDFKGTGNNGFLADPELDSFDIACASCHGATGIETVNKGTATERRVAVFTEYYGGFPVDGVMSDMNTGCEKCHGPGSGHVRGGQYGRRIVSPGMLPAGRLAMICGSCHIGGENYTDLGGGAPLLGDTDGNYRTFKPGMSPAEFFGTSDGTGENVQPFGSIEIAGLAGDGYLEPVDFETDGAASWMDIRFGAVFNHSKSSRQQYADVLRSDKFRNQREILTCISCHDAHGSSNRHMTTENADNNAVCLSCHSGSEQVFPNIEQEMVGRLKNGTATSADITVIAGDVEKHISDMTGTLQMAPYDPEGSAMGRCTRCHMPRTARSASWSLALETGTRQYREGDISSHTFDIMATESVNDMGDAMGAANTTPAGISDKCGNCHGYAGLK